MCDDAENGSQSSRADCDGHRPPLQWKAHAKRGIGLRNRDAVFDAQIAYGRDHFAINFAHWAGSCYFANVRPERGADATLRRDNRDGDGPAASRDAGTFARLRAEKFHGGKTGTTRARDVSRVSR